MSCVRGLTPTSRASPNSSWKYPEIILGDLVWITCTSGSRKMGQWIVSMSTVVRRRAKRNSCSNLSHCTVGSEAMGHLNRHDSVYEDWVCRCEQHSRQNFSPLRMLASA